MLWLERERQEMMHEGGSRGTLTFAVVVAVLRLFLFPWNRGIVEEGNYRRERCRPEWFERN